MMKGRPSSAFVLSHIPYLRSDDLVGLQKRPAEKESNNVKRAKK